jgi:acyl-coenzyme A synthetase/AMP-(fatty) acid ligase
MDYMLKRWAAFARFLEDGRICLTNNAADLREVPIGAAGELYIGGPGVMIGYVGEGSEELNKKSLIHHPKYGGPLYKTGDLVKWSSDGNLMFLGRTDFQVKIRGQRLEVGEIESVIRKHKDVKDVLVIKREDVAQQGYLAAYLIPHITASTQSQPSIEQQSHPLIEEVQKLCKRMLTSYMIPAGWVILDKFPITKNGKIDRKKLPVPVKNNNENLIIPRNPIEQKLWDIWSQILGHEDFGVRENFFEVGGHSLLAMILISKFNTTFKQNF